MQEEREKQKREDRYEVLKKKVKQLSLTSDIFFCKVMEDPLACQEAVRIITQSPICITQIKTQYSIRNLTHRSIVLDVLAEDEQGSMVNIEIHPQEDENHPKRVRYHLGSIDMNILEKGTEFEELPDVYLIYITKADFLKGKRGIYQVERMVSGDMENIQNGVYEYYVNLSEPAELQEQKALLAYFLHSDAEYQSELFPNLIKRVRHLKQDRKGVEFMCEIFEQERNEGREEGRNEGRVEGRALLVDLVRKKWNKKQTPQEAAQLLELEEGDVRYIMSQLDLNQTISNDEIARGMLH